MPRALISVSDKTGIAKFAKTLDKLGWEIIASGGTARHIKENNIPVTEVEDYTKSPEILDGRVKTLHPAIHGGILARDTEEDHQQLVSLGWDNIDMVVVNLYPFETTIAKENVTLEEAIENIDIGGVALIRAAAKNYQRVALVCDPADYDQIAADLTANEMTVEKRKLLALKGFAHTAKYDTAISAYLGGTDVFQLNGYPILPLRYGENPHQDAALYAWEPGSTPLGGKVLQGKALSYNNLLDLDAAWTAVANFDKPSIVIVKHLSPCGIASADNLKDAFLAAFESDKVSPFGGIIASNRVYDAETVEAMGKLFVECIIAPGFTPEAQEMLAKKKNCRLIEMPNLDIEPKYEIRSVLRGFLRQAIDFGDPADAEWKVVSDRQPTDAEWKALKFAWKACQFSKSNSVVFGKGEATVGIGSGQPNRVDCVHIAVKRAGENSKGAVMASDAYIPFPDSVEVAAENGVTAVIQPGGSIRDELSIEAANKAGMAMVFTGTRHFRH